MEAVLMWLLEAIGTALLSNLLNNLKDSGQLDGWMATLVDWIANLFA